MNRQECPKFSFWCCSENTEWSCQLRGGAEGQVPCRHCGIGLLQTRQRLLTISHELTIMKDIRAKSHMAQAVYREDKT